MAFLLCVFWKIYAAYKGISKVIYYQKFVRLRPCVYVFSRSFKVLKDGKLRFYYEMRIKRTKYLYTRLILTSCRRAAATICPRPSPPCGLRSASRRRADGNVAEVSHGQHVSTSTAAAAWRAPTRRWAKRPSDLDLWPWKWCPSHMWRGLTLCQFWSS